MKKFFNIKNLNLITVVLIAVVLIVNLFILRIGIEDNGSLSYTLKNLGMYDTSSASGSGYYSHTFGIDNSTVNYSSGNLVYLICKVIFNFLGLGTVIVYIPSLIYFVVFILGIYFLIKILKFEYDWNNLLTCVLFAVVLCDAGYIAYFNTPYTFAPLIAFMPLFLYSVILLAKEKTYKALILQFICSIFMFNSSIIVAVIGILYALYSLRFFTFNKSAVWKILCVVCSVFVLISNVSVVSDYKSDTSLYNSCFYGALMNRNSSAVIDLPDEYSEYIGVPAFEEKAQKLITSDKFEEFKSIVNYGTIMGYYVKNPVHLYKTVKSAAINGTIIRIPYLGNYAVGSGATPKEGSFFWNIYSTLKEKVFPRSFIFTVILLLLVIWLSLEFKFKYSKTFESGICCELLSFCAVATFVSLLATVVIFGMSEINFNLSVYSFLTDICLIFSAIGGTRMMFIKRSILKEKYGVNQ